MAVAGAGAYRATRVGADAYAAQLAAEDAGLGGRERPAHILHVDVKYAFAETVDELDVVDPLISQVAGVVVEAEALVAADSIDGALSGGNIEGNLGGMNLQGEVDILGVERVKDGAEAVAEILKPLVPVVLVGGRKGVDGVPDAGTSEPVDGHWKVVGTSGAGIEELASGLGSVDHSLGCTLANTLRVTVSPDFWR